MIRTKYYESPIGEIMLAADEKGLVGLWLPGQMSEEDLMKAKGKKASDETEGEKAAAEAHLAKTAEWLDEYFAGKNPDPKGLKLNASGTEFQKQVWSRLSEIPYGQVASYGKIAAEVAEIRGIKRMSSRAVGAANGQNPISIIVPCHRVIGSNGHLTGYGGGLPLKKWLLQHEGISIEGDQVRDNK